MVQYNDKKCFLDIEIGTDTEIPAHLKLINALKDEIRQKRLPSGIKLPSERKMTERLKINRYSVHRAYESLLNDGWLSETTGKRGLFVSHKAKQKYAPAVPCVGIVLPFSFSHFTSVGNQMSLRYFSGVIDQASSANYSTMILTLPPLDAKNEIVENWVANLIPSLAGIVYFGARSRDTDSAMQLMITHDELAQVFVTGESDFTNISTISGDVQSGGISAAELLREYGHYRIGILSPLPKNSERGKIFKSMSNHRCDIMASCFKQCNIDVCNEWSIDNCLDFERLAIELTRLFSREEKPTALWCHNDQIALETIKILNRLGVDIPNDVSIIGYDNIEGLTNSDAFLTTIQHPHYSIGCKAIDIIDELNKQGISGKAKHVKIPTSLVCRHSVAPLKTLI